MSLEIQDEFAGFYARYSGNREAVADYGWPDRINHTFQGWFDKWLREHEADNLSKDYTYSPHPEQVIREMFGKFFTSLRKRNHVHIPKKVQEAAIQEYLED